MVLIRAARYKVPDDIYHFYRPEKSQKILFFEPTKTAFLHIEKRLKTKTKLTDMM
jgi:hypothetical protein